MKRLIYLVCTGILFLSVGCDDLVWDFACYDMSFIVTDESGNNLLDPAFDGNILGNEIKAVHDGRTYEFSAPAPSSIEQKDLPPEWYGLKARQSKTDGEWHLLFGEFSPTGGYKKSKFIIYWGDGTETEVMFDLYITWKSRKNPKVHKRLYIDGAPKPDGSLSTEIIKQRS